MASFGRTLRNKQDAPIFARSPTQYDAYTPPSLRSSDSAVREGPQASPEAITDLKPGRRCEFCGRFFFCPFLLHALHKHAAVTGRNLKPVVSRSDDGAGFGIGISGRS